MRKTSQKATLYLVPTPIGNFDDITFRAVRTLNDVDYIFAEDTRVTKILLSHFNITKPQLKSYHIFNENTIVDDIIILLLDNFDIAIVSDAGTPGISDPGYLVVKKAIENNINVISLPGPTAITTALSASGLPTNNFSFFGFLDHKQTQKRLFLDKLVDRSETLVFYESPHRLKETLVIMHEIFGDREIVIARELTKKYEEYIRGPISKILEGKIPQKGEMVILVSGTNTSMLQNMLEELTIDEHYKYYLNQGNDKKEAMKLVARDRKVSKSEIYNYLLNK